MSKDTISRITDKVVSEMTEWCNRPLESVYPVVFIDAIHVKIRDGQVTNRPVYGYQGHLRGERDILGLWAATAVRCEVLAGGAHRDQEPGAADVCIVVCDGLRGLPRPSPPCGTGRLFRRV